MSGLILYTSEDGHSCIQLRAEGQTIWHLQTVALFDVAAENIRRHLKNIFVGNGLEPERTTEESSVVQRASVEAELAAIENKTKRRLKS